MYLCHFYLFLSLICIMLMVYKNDLGTRAALSYCENLSVL